VPEPRSYRQPRFQPPAGATELLLVRHGESAPHLEGESFPMVDGHGDPPLSEEGLVQAERLSSRLKHERIDAIYVTSLCRTVQTAAPLAAAVGIEARVEADLREVFLGEWEGGVFRQKVMEQDPIAVRMAHEQRWDVIPGAESNDALTDRTRAAVERITAAHPDERVVVVAHGGVIGNLLHQATGSRPWAFVGADNASISHLVVTVDRWILRRFNDTTHLDSTLTVTAAPLT
jgi:probable phosphoglycerate mutase